MAEAVKNEFWRNQDELDSAGSFAHLEQQPKAQTALL
jgi:hypothetical protein